MPVGRQHRTQFSTTAQTTIWPYRRMSSQGVPAFYGNWMFLAVFTRARNRPLSRTMSVQFTPSHPVNFNIHFNIILPPKLGFRRAFQSSDFSSTLLYATCHAHIIVPGLVIILFRENQAYKLWSSSLCSFLYPRITSSFVSLAGWILYLTSMRWSVKPVSSWEAAFCAPGLNKYSESKLNTELDQTFWLDGALNLVS
jgi:hypothetical protein